MSVMIADLCVAVSLLVLMKFVWHWSRTVYAFFFVKPLNIRHLGEWAVVTGATDGIGKAFAEELASRGLKVVLLGRDGRKLQECTRDMEKRFGVETRSIEADFAKDDQCYHKIRETISHLNIAILVNNVGMCPSLPDYFHVMAGGDKFMADAIRCNVVTATSMTRIVLPGMVRRKAGIVVNVASASALLPTPLVAIYSATKVYMDFFSRSLTSELRATGVIVQSLLPFTVSTKMTGSPGRSFWVADAADYARSSLNAVGILDRSHGCFAHSLQGWYYSTLPECISSRLQWRFFTELRKLLLTQQEFKSGASANSTIMVMSMEESISQQLLGQSPSKVEKISVASAQSDGGMIKGLSADLVSLSHLDLKDAGITSLKGLPKLPKLRSLNLEGNLIKDGEDLEWVAENCPALENLVLSANPITDLTKLEALNKLAKLTSLQLTGSEIAKVDGYEAKVFALLPSLTTVDGKKKDVEEVEDDDDEAEEEDEESDDDAESDGEEGNPGLQALLGGEDLSDDDEDFGGEEGGSDDDEEDDDDDDEDEETGDDATPKKADVQPEGGKGIKRKAEDDDAE
ncbi:Very-long-chain 3-oxoacyl-CoA reductase [Hypsibius exemplaris]|uniref:Very-long-chain 3-oxoacyl-CoA reductase n=1 Tax=Hypsibius exemplaris TaxID=2072580 RepID=A0A1W0WYB4_HYPEX|nr:Very-long-chain 3-oxoacyl-CoA reductase [Hypsibius exemplaris]